MATVDIKIQLESARAEAQLAKFNSQVKVSEERANQAALKTQLLEQRLTRAANSASVFGNVLGKISLGSFIGNITSRAVSAGISSLINGLRGIVDAGRDFEQGLISVGKTTGIEGRRLQQLGDSITELSRKIPVSTNELLNLATVAGQLGLKSTQDITQFTETLAKLQLATDVAGEEGAQSVARILTVTGELEKNGSQNIDKFGNVLTRLGNNFAATEGQILEVANRVAQGTAAFGVASEDVLAIATALKATGTEAEAGGTAIQKTFQLIGAATVEGGEKLRAFAEAAGLSEEAFVKLFQNDPSKLFLQLAKNLGETGVRGAELNKVFADLGLTDVRLTRSLNPLIANYRVLERALGDARSEAEQKTALDEEAAKAADTLNGDIQKLSNSFSELGKELFETLGPALRVIVQQITALFNFFSNNAGLLITIAAGFAAVSAALTVVAVKAAIAAGAFTATAAAATAMWLAITGPVGIAAVAIAGLVGTLYLATDGFSNAKQAAENHKKTVEDVAEGYKKADKETLQFLDSLQGETGLQQALNGVEDPALRAKDALEQLPAPMGELGRISKETAEEVAAAGKALLLFEQDKTKELQRFFKAEEQAKLESNFAIIKSEKEREAFTAFVASEGTRRREEAFKRTIGLDRETIEAEKEKQKQLQELRNAQEQFEKEQQEKQFQREEQLRIAKEQATIAERQAELFRQEEAIAFQDAEFERLTAHLDRQTQAEIAAREENVQDEIAKQQLLAEVRKRAAEEEIAQRERAKQQTASLERQKQDLTLGFAQAGATALLTLVGANNKAMFALSKAFAAADIVVKGLQAEAFALAQLGPIAGPPVAAAIKTNTALQLATLAATSVTEAARGFESGGIVGGTSFTGDRVAARVNSGEMILNRQQQSQLFAMANGQGGNGGQQEIVVHTTVELDGEAVGRSVSRQVANGLVLGEGGV